MTADWENRLLAMERGQTTEDAFMADIYAEPFAFPRWLYVRIANINWNRTSRKNGIKPKDMFTRDI